MSNPSVPLIPRKVLFGNPDRASAQISPDGAYLAWLAPRDGVLNIWVAPRENPSAARAVTSDTGRAIRFFSWAYTCDHILYLQDQNGDENWRLYAAAIRSDDIRDLTPFERTQARIIATSERYPEEVMVGLNNRQPEWHDLYRINVVTGELKLVQENDRFMGFVLDDDYRLRFSLQMTPEGSIDIYRYGEGDWQPWDSIPAEDMLATGPHGFDKTGRLVYFSDSRGRNTAALVEVDTETMQKRVLAEDSRADVSDIVRHPTGKHVQAVSFIYERKQWQVLDPAIEEDLAYLSTVADGEVIIVSRTLDDRYWTVLFLVDAGPARYYLYDRNVREASYLFSIRAALEEQPLVKMFPVVIPSRDGLDLVAYYSLPVGSDADGDGVPDQPLPMVLIPHGGPWSRDFWGYNPHHQWLTNRGYAVLNVNFRSSTGFGKSFTNAGDHEWGGKIREDQVDAVQWAVQQGIADPARVAILGGSFGGYSVLAGLTFTPELFACGVDLVGPSNLVTLLESVPPYWKPMLEMFTTRVGDFRTEEGRALLKAYSPLTYADRICRPLLIGQGANDPRVKQAESDQIVQAMQANGIPVTYLLYPDEGHGFARPENHISFNAVAESFLARCLGGRAEPIGDDFRGASLQVLAGAEEAPGLAEAMAGRDPGQA